jgi:hypothetical protein
MSLLSLAEPALPPPEKYALLKGKQLTPKRRRRRRHSVSVQCTLTAKRIALHCFHLAKRDKKDKQSLKTKQANSRKGRKRFQNRPATKLYIFFATICLLLANPLPPGFAFA